MNNTDFIINGINIDNDLILSEAQKEIEKKTSSAPYTTYDIKDCPRNFIKMNNDHELLNYYFQVLNKSYAIDITNFEILRKKTGFKANIQFLIKKIIWNLLKFYTYRLFSQQIEFNFQIKNTVIALYESSMKRIAELETCIDNRIKEQNQNV